MLTLERPISGGIEGNWEPDYQLVLVQPQETPSMEMTQYNPSGCLACFVKPPGSVELSAVRSLTIASDPSTEITQYNPSGCLACFVKSTCSAELSAVRSLIQLLVNSRSSSYKSHKKLIFRVDLSFHLWPRTTGFPDFQSGRKVINIPKSLDIEGHQHSAPGFQGYSCKD